MRAIRLTEYGGPDVLTITDQPRPHPEAGEVLVRVRAIGVNRADCMQRSGNYPLPAGESDILGLELAGDVVEAGSSVTAFAAGDRVFGLVASGAYAEFATIDEGLTVPIPDGLNDVEAASIIEVAATANETLFALANLQPGESVLIHAGGSGVGTMSIQMAKHGGATVFVTAGTDDKVKRCLELGADFGFNYKMSDFAEEIRRLTGGLGVDVIQDFVGAAYLERHLALLSEEGRLVTVSDLGGARGMLDLGTVRRKRLKIIGFTLRPQPIAKKRAVVKRVCDRWLDPLRQGVIKPIVFATFPLEQVRDAHSLMEANKNFGKIVLTVD